MSQLSALRSRATELGINFDQRWGENKLAGIIAAKEEELGILPEPQQDAQPEPQQESATDVQEDAQPEQGSETSTGATGQEEKQDDESHASEQQLQPAKVRAEETKPDSEVDSESLTVKNISGNPMTIGFIFKAKPGCTVTISGNHLTDNLRKKIAYGVKIGMLELV